VSDAWPATDILRDVQVAPDGGEACARTDLALQGDRRYLHTTTCLIAADLLVTELLADGEEITCLEALEMRRLCTDNLVLTASFARPIEPSRTPVMCGRYRIGRDRIVWFEGTADDTPVRRREEPSGVTLELLRRMRVEGDSGSSHCTELRPLDGIYASCPHPTLARFAHLELVLEATRQRIRERLARPGCCLLVAEVSHLTYPPWSRVARGCRVSYRLEEGRLSSGTELLHCHAALVPDLGTARVTIASVPESRMAERGFEEERLLVG
jgi:hypothetical protein